MDYTIPVAGHLPSFLTDWVETSSPVNPLGAKGIGESGTVAAPPTIVNAVLDALAPLGIHSIDMPLKSERIWARIEAARQAELCPSSPFPIWPKTLVPILMPLLEGAVTRDIGYRDTRARVHTTRLGQRSAPSCAVGRWTAKPATSTLSDLV